MLFLHSGDNSRACFLRHRPTWPPPGCTPWQKVAASAAHGPVLGFAETLVAIARQNAPASTANHFICTPDGAVAFLIFMTPCVVDWRPDNLLDIVLPFFNAAAGRSDDMTVHCHGCRSASILTFPHFAS
jgi:hypothetical protein